jgi:hypothetical protein
MPTSAAIRRRRALNKLGIGFPGNNDRLIEVARLLRDRVDAVVLGGVAVFLHGYERSTTDLDLYTLDRPLTYAQLESAGAKWSLAKREHVLDGVRIHTVTPEDAGHVVEATLIIQGVRLVGLGDLIAIKMICGLNDAGRMKHIADVQELIRAVPLDKRFASKLRSELRAPFKDPVDGVRLGDQLRGDRRF